MKFYSYANTKLYDEIMLLVTAAATTTAIFLIHVTYSFCLVI
jgi:hypothetical protein